MNGLNFIDFYFILTDQAYFNLLSNKIRFLTTIAQKLIFHSKFYNFLFSLINKSIYFLFIFKIKNTTLVSTTSMKTKHNILEKLFLIILYVQSVSFLDRWTMIGISLIVFGLSLHFQGAKPYWPVFMVILVFEYFQWSNVQMVLMIVTGFLLTAIKLYEIPTPGKGQFNSGYVRSKLQNVEICIFYPTKQKGKKADWFPNKGYFKTIYQIFYVDPQTKRMPFFIFAFLVSFLTKVTMPAFTNTKLYTQDNPDNKYKTIVFSHGLGANMNAYSSICSWFTSHGYVVVSVQHNHDKICIDHRLQAQKDHWKIRDYLYKYRNRDLTIRVAQVRKVIRAIIQNKTSKFWSTHLGEDINAEQIHLSGQSYGGGTVIQTLADLIKQKKDHYIKSIIALDPWMFPLEKDAYTTIKDKNILIINSQTFWESASIPYIYQLEKKFAVFKEHNKKTLKAVLVTKMNHLDQCDMAFVFGNIMQFFRKNSHYYLNQQILQLNLVLIALFLEGRSTQELIQTGNEFCKQNQLDKAGFQLLQEFRVQREMMLQFKTKRQAIVDKLMTRGQLIKRLFWP